MKRMVTVSAVLWGGIATFAACVGDDPAGASPSGDAGSSGGSSSSSSGAPDGSSSSSGGSSGSSGGSSGSSGFVPASYSLTLASPGGIGEEHTVCITKRLDNATPIHVGALRTVLTGAQQHEVIVYAVDDADESATPTTCTPFRSLREADRGIGLTISNRADETLEFPPDAGFTFGSQQMIRIELHTRHVVDETATAEVTFTSMDDAAYQHEVGMVLGGTVDIDLSPQAPATVAATLLLPTFMNGSSLLFLSGRQRSLGTDLKVALGAESVYTNSAWSNPTLSAFAPPRVLPEGTSMGLTCSWFNSTNRAARAGDSFTDETCYFRAHYAPAPASAARVCVHTEQAGAVDVCCPGGALCDQLD